MRCPVTCEGSPLELLQTTSLGGAITHQLKILGTCSSVELAAHPSKQLREANAPGVVSIDRLFDRVRSSQVGVRQVSLDIGLSVGQIKSNQIT